MERDPARTTLRLFRDSGQRVRKNPNSAVPIEILVLHEYRTRLGASNVVDCGDNGDSSE